MGHTEHKFSFIKIADFSLHDAKMILAAYNVFFEKGLHNKMLDIKKTLKQLNVLYAEDNDEIRKNTLLTLELMFANVYVAPSGIEALEIFESSPVHIILLDYVMPLMNGYEAAKEIRKKDKKIPIIVISGYADKEKLLNSIEVGVINYIEKPLQYSQLLSALEKAVLTLHDNNLLFIQLTEEVQYNFMTKQIIKADMLLQLSKDECNLLELLLKNKTKLVTKEQIIDYVFNTLSVEANTLRNLIYRFRKKTNLDIILTIKDLGYMIR